ncbi:hypothetical protein PS861_00060 [Pseudomonas fluorescens]|uniref:Uncharacterized protein n=1 Tax=Pseudomonas fluorescens TaxID=294 RepID=A0A5E7GDV1_PSEFL|nr:hypothetical protein PS861_00060 [Pseudomonas fluorescens]VVP22641.1 hypothetical protein PS900_03937 [Pseudomonas fluorescens]
MGGQVRAITYKGNFSKPCGYDRDVYNGLFTLVLYS